MTSTLQKVQVLLLVVVGIIATVFVGTKYARLNRVDGLGSYTVTAQLASPGGIFTNAEVTYRGTPVGRVGKMTIDGDGVDVALILDKDGPKIPATASATVAERSPIGEQYVDLASTSSPVGGPRLTDGSVIPRTRTSTPVPLADVLNSADSFLNSVPRDDLRTVVTQNGAAFAGQTENLTRLLTSLNGLSKTYADRIAETKALVTHSDPVLKTQAAQSNDILTWSRGLDVVTQTLKSSDSDVRRLLTTGQSSSREISTLVKNDGDDLSRFVGDFGSLQRTLKPALPYTNATLALLGALAGGTAQALPGDGTVHYTALFDFGSGGPPSCTDGYESTQALIREMQRKNSAFRKEVDEFPFNTKAGCTVPLGSPTDVRGSARVGFGDVSKPVPWDNTPKKDPDALNLNPLGTQLAYLLGVKPVNQGGFGDAGRVLGLDHG